MPCTLAWRRQCIKRSSTTSLLLTRASTVPRSRVSLEETVSDGISSVAGACRPSIQVLGRPRTADDENTYADKVQAGELLLLDVDVGPADLRGSVRDRWLDDLERHRATAQKQPDDASPYFFQGVALFNLGRNAEAAQKAFNAYHAMSEDFGGPRPPQALLYARDGQAKQARKDLRAFAKVSPDRHAVLATNALVEIYLGNVEGGVKTLEETVRENSKDATLAFRAACVYARASEAARVREAAWAAGLAAAPSAWSALAAPPSPRANDFRAKRSLLLLRQSPWR